MAGNDFRVASRTQNTVHLGHFLPNVPLIPLGQAAGDQNFAHQALRLQGGGLQNDSRWLRISPSR